MPDPLPVRLTTNRNSARIGEDELTEVAVQALTRATMGRPYTLQIVNREGNYAASVGCFGLGESSRLPSPTRLDEIVPVLAIYVRDARLVPTASVGKAVRLTQTARLVGISWNFPGEPSRRFDDVDNDSLPVIVRQFLDRIWSEYSQPAQLDWMMATERLLKRLDVLLTERDALRRELAKVYGDLDIAEARVRTLEAINEALQQEHGRTKNRVSKTVLGFLAAAVLGILPTTADHVLDAAFAKPVNDAVEAAEQVVVDCGMSTITITKGDTSRAQGSVSPQEGR